jgi:hypothetical protein
MSNCYGNLPCGANSSGVGIDRFVFGEIPIGAVNGINTIFSTEFEYVSGTLSVYLDGVKKNQTDITELSNQSFQFVVDATNPNGMNQAPSCNEIIAVSYVKTENASNTCFINL